MNICPKCQHSCRPCNYKKHVNSCSGIKSYNVRLNEGLIEYRDQNNLNCKFCNQPRKNLKSILNHERLCKLNPNKQTTHFQNKEFQQNKKGRGENQYTKAKRLGLPKPVISNETREKLSTANKLRSPEFRKKQAEQISKTVRKKVERGEWHTSLAKNMRHEYKGVVLHGSWEIGRAHV